MPAFTFAARGRRRPVVPPPSGLGLVYPSSGVIVADPIASLSGLSSTWQFTSSILGVQNVSFSEEWNSHAWNGGSQRGTYAVNGLVGFDGVAQDCATDNHVTLETDPTFGQVLRNAKHPEWNLCFNAALSGADYRAYIPYVEFPFQSQSSYTATDVWVRYVMRYGGDGGVYSHNGSRGNGTADQKQFTWHSGTVGLGSSNRLVYSTPGTGEYGYYYRSGSMFSAGVSLYSAGTFGADTATMWTRQSDTGLDPFGWITSGTNFGGGYDTAQTTWADNNWNVPRWEEHIYRYARDATGDSVIRARYRRQLTGTRVLNGVTQASAVGAFGFVDATTAAAGYIWGRSTALKTGVAALPYKIGLNENSNRCTPNSVWTEYAALTIVDGVANPNPFQLDANIL